MINRTQRQALRLTRQSGRSFSNALVAASPTGVNDKNVMSIVEWSNVQTAKKNQEVAAEADYAAQLRQFSTDKGAFKPI